MSCQEGDVPGLAEVLVEDITVWSDGGGKTLAALRPIYGVQAVTRLWLGLARKAPADLHNSFDRTTRCHGVEITTIMENSLDMLMSSTPLTQRFPLAGDFNLPE